MPTHAEGDRIAQAIRDGLKAQGRLGKERIVNAWVPSHLTDAQKSDVTEYEPGYLVQFQQNAPGHTKGSRLDCGRRSQTADELANRFEVYRPVQVSLAAGDRGVHHRLAAKRSDGTPS